MDHALMAAERSRAARSRPARRLARCRGPAPDRHARDRGARAPARAEQHGAGGAEPHRHLVHRPALDFGDGGDRRSPLACPARHLHDRRRRDGRADAGRAGLWRRPLPAHEPDCLARPLGLGADDSRVRADDRLRAGDDPRLRARAGRRGARDRLLDSAHDRRAAGGGAVGGGRLLQWHRPHAHPARHRPRGPRLERRPERDLHLPIRHGHGGRRLGDDSRRADRRRARDPDDPAPRPRALLAAPDLAAEGRAGSSRSLRSDCRWR